jgi:hypothetical protein
MPVPCNGLRSLFHPKTLFYPFPDIDYCPAHHRQYNKLPDSAALIKLIVKIMGSAPHIETFILQRHLVQNIDSGFCPPIVFSGLSMNWRI